MVIATTFAATATEQDVAPIIGEVIQRSCIECHNKVVSEGGFDLSSLQFELSDRNNRQRWIRIHDRVQQGEMPPEPHDLPGDQRDTLMRNLAASVHDADMKDVEQSGRGPMRRLTRDEYQQNLRPDDEPALRPDRRLTVRVPRFHVRSSSSNTRELLQHKQSRHLPAVSLR